MSDGLIKIRGSGGASPNSDLNDLSRIASTDNFPAPKPSGKKSWVGIGQQLGNQCGGSENRECRRGAEEEAGLGDFFFFLGAEEKCRRSLSREGRGPICCNQNNTV